MGSDMSRPRYRRNCSADAYRERGSKNLVCREIDCDFVDRRDCVGRRPCFKPDPIRTIPPIDPCLDPCRISRCSTPNQCMPSPCVPLSTSNYVDYPVDTKYYRQNRYQTTTRPMCYKEDDFYLEPRQMSVKKSYSPYVYDDCDRITKLPADCDIIPAEKIYEIRKEKVLIKTDRSQSPPRIRSKSSDRYLDIPKTVRIVNESYRPEKSVPIETERPSRVRSRSGYLEETHIRSESTERKIIETNNIKNKSQVCLNNDIIYVPMVREEFIKRESQKLNAESDHSETESYRRRPNKIIIREVEQPNIKSILKSQLEANGIDNSLAFERFIIEEQKNKKNEDKNSASTSTSSSPNVDLKSSSYSSLKFSYSKDGSLRYTYE